MRRALAIVLLMSVPLVAARDEFTEDLERLTPLIGLTEGQSVADIGGGRGQLTVALAKAVGPSGRVFSTEMTDARLDDIRDAAKEAGLSNVTVVQAHDTRTNLPEGCCDAVVIRNVYHHFTDPRAMNRSLFETVKPGGYVAVIDFRATNRSTAAPAHRGDSGSHGVDPDTVVRELTAAGFERASVEPRTDDRRGFLVVMRRARTSDR